MTALATIRGINCLIEKNAIVTQPSIGRTIIAAMEDGATDLLLQEVEIINDETDKSVARICYEGDEILGKIPVLPDEDHTMIIRIYN